MNAGSELASPGRCKDHEIMELFSYHIERAARVNAMWEKAEWRIKGRERERFLFQLRRRHRNP